MWGSMSIRISSGAKKIRRGKNIKSYEFLMEYDSMECLIFFCFFVTVSNSLVLGKMRKEILSQIRTR